MNRIFGFVGAAVAALVSIPFAGNQTDAADFSGVPPPAPVWSWTGPYVGLHAGAVDGDVRSDTFFRTVFSEDQSLTLALDSVRLDPDGIMGGLQAGYNFQIDSIVLGLEGDVSFGDVDDVIYPFDGRNEVEVDWMATIRARLGWAWDRTLFYVTGGVAFTELKLKINDFADTNSMVGWTAGGGVEHALTDDISLKAEYLYADFGRETFRYDEETVVIIDDEILFELFGKADLETHTFRVGVNWLF